MKVEEHYEKLYRYCYFHISRRHNGPEFKAGSCTAIVISISETR